MFCITAAEISVAQSGQNQNDSSNSEEVQESSDQVVRLVRFTGNDNVSNRSLSTLVRTRNNREFLGIPRFTPWYYIHQLVGVGESPTLLDRETVASDMERIRLYYENMGYFDTRVDTTIIEYRPNRFEVSFIIEEGRPSRLRSVSYTGLPDFRTEENLKEDFFSESLYSGNSENDSTFSVNEQYNAQKLRQEQSRIIDFLKNHGFAAAQRDSVRALIKRDEDDTYTMDVLYSIRPGDFYTFGDVHIKLAGPDGNGMYEESLTEIDPQFVKEGFSVNMEKQINANTKFDLLTEQLQFRAGDTFDQSAYLRSVNSYQNLGMLLINRFGLSADGSLPDYSQEQIPVYFDLQTLPKHSIRTEIFGMRRYGFGTGIGLNYNNNNLLGRAENLTVALNTNLEFVTSNTLNEISPRDEDGNRTTTGSAIFQSYEFRVEYALPRLNWPLSPLSDAAWIESARTRYSLSYSQSNQLFFDINSDVRFNLRYELRHSRRFQSLIDMFELDVVDTDPSSQFRQNLINEFGENSIELLRIEEDFRPQFSSVIRYTFRAQNTNIIKRNYGYFSEYSVALGGNIPYLIDRYLVTPGDIEGTLPSPLNISSNSLAYSRFFKLSADYRRYISLSPDAVAAFRLFGGYAHPIGQSDNIPLNRRFFAGGSNDIRGWSPFRLGPGSIPPDEVTIPGGEVKLAAFTEIRQTFMKNVLSADWYLAWHTDAGNVWYGPGNTFIDEQDTDLLRDGRFRLNEFYNQVAVGSGLGIRLDWEFIVARFDFTFRAHDLEQGWFNNRQMYFSFGIGHSF
ncbi:BamA/TamA family outer membrane protein [Rhodohalobacter halophilus]|uniref:BamA/TamA family outer membrane protein n=1 Tax=Rhodohalobacter halophilus TaxID=1812810 RepID=UPI001FE09516|nr:outer membrane protein assembly factor [Rhodohalobacter halophilus]